MVSHIARSVETILRCTGAPVVQVAVEVRARRPQVARLSAGQRLLASPNREEPLSSDNHSLHAPPRFELSLQPCLRRGQLIVMLPQLFEVAPRMIRCVMH